MPTYTSTTIPTDIVISFNTSVAASPHAASSEYKALLRSLHAAGLRATGRRGERLGHILVFIWCPDVLLRKLHNSNLIPPPPSKCISIVYEYLLTVLNSPTSPTSPTSQKHPQPQKRTWSCITTITPLHDADFTEKWAYAWSRSRPFSLSALGCVVPIETIHNHFGPSTATHFAFMDAYIKALVGPAVVSLLVPCAGLVGVVFYGVWMVVFVEWWNLETTRRGKWGWREFAKVVIMLGLSAFPTLGAGRWVNYSWVATTIPKLIYTLVLFIPLIDFDIGSRSGPKKTKINEPKPKPNGILRINPNPNAASTPAPTPKPNLIHINTNQVRGILQIRTHSPSPSPSLSPSSSPTTPPRVPTPPTPSKKVTFSLSHLHTPTYAPTYAERELVSRALREISLPPSPFSSSFSSSAFVATLFFPSWYLAPLLALASAVWGMRKDARGVGVRYRRPVDVVSKSKKGYMRGMKWIGWLASVWGSVSWYLSHGTQAEGVEGKDVLLVGLVASHVYLGVGWVVRRGLRSLSSGSDEECVDEDGDGEWVDVTPTPTEDEETEVVKEFWAYDEGVRDVKMVLDDA